jgi:N-acetylneuraminic acid mutarotase
MWQNQARVWMLNPFDTQWSPAPALPQPQSEVAGCILPDGSLFITSGRTPAGEANGRYDDQRDTDASWRLAPGATRWVKAAPLPVACNSAAFALLGGRLHVIGGRTSTPKAGGGRADITNLAMHHSYDPGSDQWVAHAPLPAPRGGHAAAVLGGGIHVFGGEAFSPTPVAFRDHLRWDPRTDRWTQQLPMPGPRHGLGAVAAPGGQAIHLFGGAAEAGASGTLRTHLLFGA